MRNSRCVALAVFSVIAVTVVPLTTTGISAGAVRSSTTPPIGRQLAKLKGSDTTAYDGFGLSVAISGTTAVVGAPGHANFGGDAYVFSKTAAGWEQVTELKASDTEGSSSANIAGDGFGLSVEI